MFNGVTIAQSALAFAVAGWPELEAWCKDNPDLAKSSAEIMVSLRPHVDVQHLALELQRMLRIAKLIDRVQFRRLLNAMRGLP